MAHAFSCGRHGEGKYEPTCEHCDRAKQAYWDAKCPKPAPVKNLLTGEANGTDPVVPTFGGNWKKCPEHTHKREPILAFRKKSQGEVKNERD